MSLCRLVCQKEIIVEDRAPIERTCTFSRQSIGLDSITTTIVRVSHKGSELQQHLYVKALMTIIKMIGLSTRLSRQHLQHLYSQSSRPIHKVILGHQRTRCIYNNMHTKSVSYRQLNSQMNAYLPIMKQNIQFQN